MLTNVFKQIIYMKALLSITMLFYVVSSFAQTDEELVRNTLDTFFEGLHKGDSALIKTAIHSKIHMQTAYKNKEGESLLKFISKENFLNAISSKKADEVWLEKLSSYTIKIDGILASIWTPYQFFVNDKLSHCGVNFFQLFNNKGKWEIIYVVDTRRSQNCDF